MTGEPERNALYQRRSWVRLSGDVAESYIRYSVETEGINSATSAETSTVIRKCF